MVLCLCKLHKNFPICDSLFFEITLRIYTNFVVGDRIKSGIRVNTKLVSRSYLINTKLSHGADMEWLRKLSFHGAHRKVWLHLA